jgi:hypothetical protein
MDKINKYLGEGNSKYKHGMWLDADGNPMEKGKKPTEKEVLRSMGAIEGNTLKTAYYGVGDHIEKLAIMLNGLNGDTGLFGNDLKYAVKARDAFRKITLGKYV